jgi:hypothetical protein
LVSSYLTETHEDLLNDPLVNSRFSLHFGQESPRLDKDQSILGTQPTTDHWTFRLFTSLCFGLPELQYSRFNTIFVDRSVDVNDFRTLISDSMEEWKSSLSSVSSPSLSG